MSPRAMLTKTQGRTYTYSDGWKLAMWICGPLLLLMGPVCALAVIFGGDKPATMTQVLVMGVCSLGMSALGGAGILGLLKFRVTLFLDRIEYHSGFSRSVFMREEIGAIRTLDANGTPMLRLFRSDNGKKLATIGLYFKPDHLFYQWFDGIENLNDEETKQDEERIAKDESLGENEDARRQAATRARKLIAWVDGGAVVLSLLAIFYPRPYALVVGVTAFLPLLGIALFFKFKSFVYLDSQRNSPRQGLDATLLMPGAALGLRAIYDTNLVEVSALVVPTILGTMLLLAALRKAQLAVKIWKIALVGSMFWAYPASAIAIGNQYFDSSEAKTFSVEVVDKRQSKGKGTTRYITLGAGGPWAAEHEESVWKSIYDDVEPGDSSCLLIRSGAFHIPWWTIRKSCADSCE